MQTRCQSCYKWTTLPDTRPPGDDFHIQCAHCQADMPATLRGSRYLHCRLCGHYYLRDLDLCPICPPPGDAVAVPWLRLVLDAPAADGAAAGRVLPRPLSDSYCISLWEDYQREQAGAKERVQAGGSGGRAGQRSGPSPSPAPVVLPTGPVALFEVPEVTANGNGAHGDGDAGANGAGSESFIVKANEGLDGVDYELISDQAHLAEVAEILASEPVLSVDTETDGLDPFTSRLLLLQVSTPRKVYVIDCQRVNPIALKPLLESDRTLKLLQNAKFDYKMLKHIAGIELCHIYDTMLAERLLTAGRAREISLLALARKYAGITMDKTIRKSFVGVRGDGYLSPEQLTYAARDAMILFEIQSAQAVELKKWRLEKVANLENECVAAVGDMELAGVEIDVARWRGILERVAVERDRAAQELNNHVATVALQTSMFGVPVINLNSNAQLIEAFARLGVNLEDTREQTLVKFTDHPAIKTLLEYRGHEKTLSAFGEELLKLINPKTRRIHPDFNQYGADTGRFSCLAGDTLVSSATGLRRIDSIQTGDVVQTAYGPKRVLAAWCNGVRPLVRLTLSDGRVLRLTADHRVLTGPGDTWSTVEELTAGDNMFISLKGADILDSPTPPSIDIDPGAYYTKRKVTIPHSLTVALCELAGLITADGTFAENQSHRLVRGKRGVRFTSARYDRVLIDCGWQDDEVIDLVKKHSLDLFGVAFTEQKHRTARRLVLASTQVSGALARLGLAGTAHTKIVPDAILGAPAVFQAAYLRGLFEGDGYITRNGDAVGLTSVNRQLLATVQTMLSFLGCHAALRKRTDSSGFAGTPRYMLSIAGRENVAHFMRVVGFISSRKNQRVSNVQRSRLGVVTPISVSGSQLYREAALHGRLRPSRQAVKPFISLYERKHQRTNTLDKLIERWGDLPELKRAAAYRTRGLHCLQVVSIEPSGEEPVYDLTIEDVGEFLANGVVVHNCTNPNVQQIPATSDFRGCFVAGQGNKLITSDYSQAELRILAELSGDPAFVEAFTSGGDLHAITASQMFQVPLESVTKTQRSAAKSINFGLAYGRGPGSLALQLGVSPDEAKQLIGKYFQAYQGVQKWLDKAARDAVKKGYSETTLGRKRFYNMPRQDDPEYRTQIAAIERQGKNTPIQGCLPGHVRIFEQSQGYVPIGELAGQQVHVWDGDRYVSGTVLPSGEKQLIRMYLYGGQYIECSPEHRFLTRATSGKDVWKTPAEIKGQDRIVLSAAIPAWECGFTLPPSDCNGSWNARSISLSQISDHEDLGEWLGRLASDGSVQKTLVYQTVAEHEESILPRIRSISEKLGYVGHDVRSTTDRPSRFHKLTISSRGLAGQLRLMGVKERVPACAWRSSRLLGAYLRGLFDGDGGVHPDGAVLTFGQGSRHLKWAREVQEALLLLGIRSRLNVYEAMIHLKVLKKDMPLFAERVGFMNPDKQAKATLIAAPVRERIYGRAIRVKTVEVTDEWVDMYDVVNSESGRFMANGLVVHNSNADMTKIALIYLRSALRSYDARTVNTVHDEIVVEASEQCAEEVKHIVEREMVRAGEQILRSVPVVADAAVGDYWKK